MITIYKNLNIYDSSDEKKKQTEIRGLSTDEKPFIENLPELNNGATFIEIDTGKMYMFDLENNQWKEI